MELDITQSQPPEVLSKIFSITCGEDVFIPPMAHRYPWILGHICSRWRQILWDTPSIWKQIVIMTSNLRGASLDVVGDEITGYKKSIREMLRFILAHIKPPVSLSVLGSMDFVSDVIFAQPEHFSALFLSDTSQHALVQLLSLPLGVFPNLEDLTLAVPPIGNLFLNCVTSPFQTAPKLRSVKYRMHTDAYIPFLMLLPWSQLTDFKIEVMEIPLIVIYDIWKLSPCLKSCEFRLGGIEEIPTSAQMILSTLNSLHITTYTTLDWDSFLKPIVVPSLEDLSITAPKILAPPLTALMLRSRCAIKVLNIYETNYNEDDISSSIACDLFHCLAKGIRFIVTWTLPTSAIHSIGTGALPNLARADFTVRPEACSALFDILDLYINQPESRSRRLPSFDIVCRDGPGVEELWGRYRARCRVYASAEGVDIHIADERILQIATFI